MAGSTRRRLLCGCVREDTPVNGRVYTAIEYCPTHRGPAYEALQEAIKKGTIKPWLP